VVYYDLLNEPSEGTPSGSAKNWRTLAIETANAIRAIDNTNTKKFIFEMLGGENNYTGFADLPGSDWMYSVHMYTPHLVTHQGVGKDWVPLSYPGNITEDIYNWPGAPDGWDKSTLIQYLDVHCGLSAFAQNHEIYVGEFGCARWAPGHGAYSYIRDCLEIFEARNWNWVYFQDGPYATDNYGANTWSAQYDEVWNSGTPAPDPTDRLQLLQRYWGRNRK
jgi:hypothetical protein